MLEKAPTKHRTNSSSREQAMRTLDPYYFVTIYNECSMLLVLRSRDFLTPVAAPVFYTLFSTDSGKF